MTIEQQTLKLAHRLFRQKRARRRALAALSFPEKISLLVQMQKIAAEISAAARRKTQQPWKIKS